MSASEPTTSFSTSGEDAITRTIEVVPDSSTNELSEEKFNDFYEVEETARGILTGGYERVALQFPDELLHDSVPIFRRLKQRISESQQNSGKKCELYILADTSYGSCCVDEVAAQHVNADLMVHYGHACMTTTSRLPVIYVFGRKNLNVDKCVDELIHAFDHDRSFQGEEGSKTKAILLKHDVAYTHQADLLFQKLREKFAERVPSIEVLYDRISKMSYLSSTTTSDLPHNSNAVLKDSSVFYIGGESLGLTNFLMTNSGCDIYTYNPQTERALYESGTGRTNKLLMKRYVAVQKARDSDVFAILVGTLGVASYLPLISHLRRLLARKQKKCYTISVGKLNPAKLANFLEIECFVLVACPENSLIDDKEFLKPIVTPYELEVAMQAEQSWTGRYVLDFEKLLLDANNDGQDVETSDTESDRPNFSLLTGTYRQARRFAGKRGKDSSASEVGNSIILRNQDGQLAKMDNAGGQFLQQRTFQGLEMRLGQDEPSVLEQGRSGIARAYQEL